MERSAVQKHCWSVDASTHTWNDLYSPVWQYIYSLYIFVYADIYVYIYTVTIPMHTYATFTLHHRNPWCETRWWAVCAGRFVSSAAATFATLLLLEGRGVMEERNGKENSGASPPWGVIESQEVWWWMVAMYQWYYRTHPLKERLVVQDHRKLKNPTYSVCSSFSRYILFCSSRTIENSQKHLWMMFPLVFSNIQILISFNPVGHFNQYCTSFCQIFSPKMPIWVPSSAPSFNAGADDGGPGGEVTHRKNP